MLRQSRATDRSVTYRLSRYQLATLLALTFLAVALLLLLRSPAPSYQSFLLHGDEYAAKAERTAAVAAYEGAARLRPNDSEPRLRLAQLYLGWGRTGEALAALAEAERLGTDDDVALERLWITAYEAHADWPAVVERAYRLLALAPDDREARHALARAYIELRAWGAARDEYEALLESDEADSLAHERLGALLIGYDDAVATRHLFAARTGLADQLLGALDAPDVTDDPAYASALVGRVLFEAEEWALAVHQFERALAYSPAYADAHAYLGYALDRMGYGDEAYPHLQQAVALAPDSVVSCLFLGLHYERLGDYAAARAKYETAYDLDPENPAACVVIGRTWIAEKDYSVAEIWLVHAVSLRPDDPVLWEILADFYLEHNITSEERGTTTAAKLVELAPGGARAYDLQGWAALQVGDYDAAQESLTQALAIDPSLASAHYHFGLLWSAQGDMQRAREAFTRALDLDTTGELAELIERVMETMP
jgi:tetratricopeptide (TPR) repeat protein